MKITSIVEMHVIAAPCKQTTKRLLPVFFGVIQSKSRINFNVIVIVQQVSF